MTIRMSIARCCCVGCPFPTCWYDVFDGYTVGDQLAHVPLNDNDADPAATPYRAIPVGGVGGAFLPRTLLDVITGDQVKMRSRYNDGSFGGIAVWKNFSDGDLASLLGTTYADRHSATVDIDSWDKGTDSTTDHQILLSTYYPNGFYIDENSDTSFTAYFELRKETTSNQLISIPSFTNGMDKKFTINIWDGTDEGDLGGGTGVELAKFEWEALIDDVVVLESLTGGTRNYDRMLIGATNWCSGIRFLIQNANNSGCSYILNEISCYTSGDTSCIP